jgi:hypothetical protein
MSSEKIQQREASGVPKTPVEFAYAATRPLNTESIYASIIPFLLSGRAIIVPQVFTFIP